MSSLITQKPELTTDTRVSGYDRLSAVLVAGVVIVGFLVFLLFMIWLYSVVDWGGKKDPVLILELAGNDNRPEGIADDWQEPGVEEFPEVDIPQLADALEATTDAVSSIRAQLETVDGDAAEMGRGRGLGDRRARGPGSGNADIIPEADRWKIEITASTAAEYMGVLEFFDITLGVVSQLSNRIDYVDNLTGGTSVAAGERKDETRLFFMNSKSRLRRWDENKASDEGVDLRNTLVGHFYSAELRARLLAIEAAVYSAEGKDLTEVQRTQFRIRPSGGGYEYYIPDGGIEYRPKPRS